MARLSKNIKFKKSLTFEQFLLLLSTVSNFADVAELVDALDLGSSVFGVRVRVSSSACYLNLYEKRLLRESYRASDRIKI